MRCLCRAGYFWDSTAGACLTCAIGSFKNWVASSSSCPMSCPNETTSAVGAASVWECYCTGDAIDTNPQLDSFTCTDSMQLFGNSSETDHFAATEASVFSFNQTLRVTDASTETLVAEIRQQLSQFLELTLASRAYIELAVRLDTSWYVDLTVWSSERPIAHQLQNKFDPEPFAAWISSSAIGTALDSAQGVSRSEVEVVALQCPDGLGLRAGRYVRGMQDCQCPHGMQPSVSGSPGLEDGCTKCPLGSYKSSVGDVSCQPCPEPLTTTVDGAVAYSTCRYICTPGFYNNDPKVPTSCVECGVGGYCIDSIRTPCPPSESTVDATASSIGECLCASGSRFEIAEETADECLNCTAGKFKALVGDLDCMDCEAGRSSGPGQSACDICDPGRYATKGSATCEPCPPGRYLESEAATSVDACVRCPIGTWGNETAAALASTCMPCISGSTTESRGSDDESFCVRPDPDQPRECVSGRLCSWAICSSFRPTLETSLILQF